MMIRVPIHGIKQLSPHDSLNQAIICWFCLHWFYWQAEENIIKADTGKTKAQPITYVNPWYINITQASILFYCRLG